MRSTKYGSLERYLLELVRQSNSLGYKSVLQYEDGPLPVIYAAALAREGADVVIMRTAHRTVGSIGRLCRLLYKVRPEVVQFHFSDRHVVFGASLMARRLGARRIVSMVHNVHHLTPRSRAKWAYNRCDCVLAVSEAVREDLLNGGVRPTALRTHYLGLLRDGAAAAHQRAALRAELGVPADGTVIANIAFDAPFKGVDILVRSLPEVLERFPGVYLVQVGVDPSESDLAGLATALGVSNKLRWVGIRDNGSDVLAAADVYVQPSRSGEGLPLAIMEAMAAALPVVATRVAGNTEAVIDSATGILVDPDEPAALSLGLIAMLSRSEDWDRFGKAGYDRFKEMFDGRQSVMRLITQAYDINTARSSGL